MVVLHYTGMAGCAAALQRLCDPEYEVSAHYVVSDNGVIYQLVDEEMRAWHAGAGQWGDIRDINSHSIGIELDNKGPLADLPDFPAPQMAALKGLLAGILARHNIRPEHVIGHSDMAILRKVDPGPKFDWHGLADGGLSIWPKIAGNGQVPDASVFLKAANRFGYHSETADISEILAAFRLRFFPAKSGPLDSQDMAAIADLAARFAPPVLDAGPR